MKSLRTCFTTPSFTHKPHLLKFYPAENCLQNVERIIKTLCTPLLPRFCGRENHTLYIHFYCLEPCSMTSLTRYCYIRFVTPINFLFSIVRLAMNSRNFVQKNITTLLKDLFLFKTEKIINYVFPNNCSLIVSVEFTITTKDKTR